jgi:hypothetical protein
MDVSLLTAFLAPFVPLFLKAGEAAASEVGSGIGQDALSYARRLWDRLWPSLEENPAALEAARDVADRPKDDDRVTALKVQLEKLLEADGVLAADVARLFAEADDAKVVVTVTGDRAVVTRDVSNSVINTGDNADIR